MCIFNLYVYRACLSLQKVNDDGSYEYLYETSNGILAQESGVGGVVAQGSAQWMDENGIGVQFSYVADHNGYKPSGNFLPQGPPIPPYILKALAYMKEHPWADQDKYAKRK